MPYLGQVTMADDPCLAALPWKAGTEPAHQYYRARYYDPKIGRFISEDPIGFEGGVNFFSYVFNNPTAFVDPWGLDVNVCYYPGSPAGFGHLGFGVGNETATHGFYSRDREPIGPGEVKKDDSSGQRVCKTLEATPQQDQCMTLCRDRRRRNPGTYNVATRNCAQFVQDCLIICGLPPGHRDSPEPRHVYNTLPPVLRPRPK